MSAYDRLTPLAWYDDDAPDADADPGERDADAAARAVADREQAAVEFGDEDPLAGVEAYGGHALGCAGDGA